ncbi:sensor histidine kinase [Paenibacillus sp. N1-5-1-14]|uniref:cache domain-containing sensor histidine kinase n=1 Tax=Paenibacillus radicibacter TaxID=2972488 RepID=UPI002158C564|nr:sensor histidine kinase [Paenibacillus radicibacter]MCR8644017.1 sensor histidine kinase [Paenibacillus radicibacter]
MKRFLRRSFHNVKVKSIQFVITVSFTLISVVMLIVGIALYQKFSNTAEQNAFLNTEQIVDQVSYNLEYYIKGMSDLFEVIDYKIQNNKAVESDVLREQLDGILSSRQDIVSLALFTNKGEIFTEIPKHDVRRNVNYKEQSWFQAAMENPNHLTFSLPHIQNIFKDQYKWVVSMSKEIVFNRGGEQVRGVLLIDVNFKTIDDLCQRVSLGKKGYVYIIDESAGNIVYHPQQQLINVGLKYENVEQALQFSYGRYTDKMNDEKRLITVKTVSNIGWKIIGVSYLNEIVTVKKDTGSFIVWLLVIVILCILLLSAFMSARISKPINRLKKSMEQVERGDFDISINVKGGDEVEQLSRRFNLMVARIRQLMDQSMREQETKRKNELEVLQSQINPHFLYNTLNSVVRMVGSGKSEDVVTTITSLSKFFRISLSRGKSIITVQEELEHIRHYLIIQTMRYKNKFDYEITIDDRALVCLTPKLVLQPIVENAIYHGIEYMVDKGLIQITASVVDEKVLIVVRDNGLGMKQEALANILVGETKSDAGSGVGVRNVHERIRLYFGEMYGLEIESELEEGTEVRIWLPLLKEGDEASG